MPGPTNHRSRWRSLDDGLWVVALLGLATGLGLWLERHLSVTSLSMLYMLTVVVAAYRLRWWVSLLCALGAVLCLNFFFLPPRWTFQVDSPEHGLVLFVMLVVALSISHLVSVLRRQTTRAQHNETCARRLQALAEQLASAGSLEEAVAQGQASLDEAFTGPNRVALLQADGVPAIPAVWDSQTGDGLRACVREAAVLGPGTGRWPGLAAWFLPLGSGSECVGAVSVTQYPDKGPSQREHAQALCALLAQALRRLRLQAAMQVAQQESARQQVQSTYLAAISHDLRTPLAALVGAASALQTQRNKLSIAEQDRLLDSMVSEAQFLSTMTENTLQLVRLTSLPEVVRRDWQSVEEIVGAVLHRLRQRDTTRRIKAHVAAQLPLIRGDAVLLEQLLGNLLDNALKYSSGSIDLMVNTEGQSLVLAVKDRGTEIPLDQYTRIFEPYFRNDHSGQRGAGLGLALCRTIAQAHGGSLALRRRRGGGNSFSMSLPLEPNQPSGLPP